MSNIIKPYAYVAVDETLTIDRHHFRKPIQPEAANTDEYPVAEEKIPQAEIAEKMLADARLAAEEQLRHAAEETVRMREEAAADIEAWWNERRLEDIRLVEESKQNGFDAGFREGFEHAEALMKERYESMLREAGQLIEEAHRVKESVIAEAEPFLVELALGIARKIIGNHVQVSSEWTLEHVKKTLARRREKGVITLCVAPSQFSKMQEARAELSLAIDSQAELQIVPDHTVDEGGCVVRSSFGSIDARIDTQLAEVKAVLLDVALSGEAGDP